MNLQVVMARFAEFSALAGEELHACESLCRDAAAELAGRSLMNDTGVEQLCSASAALAYYRYCLMQYSGVAPLRLGHTGLVTEGTLAAAKMLCEQYLNAAAPFLHSAGFHFKQVSV